MVTKDFPIFDCDSHVVEPPEIWDEYVPSAIRSWVKTQFHFHTDTDVLHINGRVVPATRERSNAAEVGWPRWSKKEVGALVPGTEEWKRKFGRLAGCRDPHARLRDMDALGTDQVMLFPTWFVRLALVKDPEAAGALARAYNDWVYDYCAADRRRLFPCAVLAIQSVEQSIAELRRVAKRGFKAAAIRPCFWNGRYPTLPEFDPLWREFEDLNVVLAMHTFPSREALTPEWGERIARTRGSGDGLLFTDEAVVYSPGQFLSNIVFSMEPSIDSSEALGFIFEAMTWLTAVLMTGWLDKFPRLRAAVLESNATWLPLVLSRSRNFLDLYAFQRRLKVRDPLDVFTSGASSPSRVTRSRSTACGITTRMSGCGPRTILITMRRTRGRRSSSWTDTRCRPRSSASCSGRTRDGSTVLTPSQWSPNASSSTSPPDSPGRGQVLQSDTPKERARASPRRTARPTVT
jgi:predicted TIM-barrel fold metal-dependent hydrolase